MGFDYNCYTGRWPFSKSRKVDFNSLRLIHERYGITKGYVSSLDAILYNDPTEGDLELYDVVKGTGYEIVPSLNPLLPNIERDYKIADGTMEYRSVRFYPSIHGYDYDCPEFIEAVDMAHDRDKAVFIQTSFGDPRLDYLLTQRMPDISKLPGLIEGAGNTVIVLCNLRIFEIVQLAEFFRNRSNLYYDMSELKHSMFAIEELAGNGILGNAVFGSFFPMFDFSGAYIHFKGTEQSTRDDILGRNIFERGTE